MSGKTGYFRESAPRSGGDRRHRSALLAGGCGWAAATALVLAVGGCTTTEQEKADRLNADGVYLYKQGEYARALNSFQLALSLRPEDPGIHYNIGQCFAQLGDPAKAEHHYRVCLAKDARNAECRHELIRLLLLQGRRREADEMIQTWLTSRPDSADPYVADAWRHYQDGDLLKAQARLQQALNRDPHHVRGLMQLGMLYEVERRPERALALYEKALRRAPDHPFLRQRVAALVAKGVKTPLPDN